MELIKVEVTDEATESHKFTWVEELKMNAIFCSSPGYYENQTLKAYLETIVNAFKNYGKKR